MTNFEGLRRKIKAMGERVQQHAPAIIAAKAQHKKGATAPQGKATPDVFTTEQKLLIVIRFQFV